MVSSTAACPAAREQKGVQTLTCIAAHEKKDM